MDYSQVRSREKFRYRTLGYSTDGLLYLHWVPGDLIADELPVVAEM